MKTHGLGLSLVVLLGASTWLAGCGQQQGTPDAQPSEQKQEQQQEQSAAPPALEPAAVKLVDSLSSGDFAGVVNTFDATMKAALPEAKLRQTWTGLTQQVGAFKSRGGARATTEAGFDVVYVTCVFERATLNAKVVFSSGGQVCGLFLQ